jgi:hypothetical protein
MARVEYSPTFVEIDGRIRIEATSFGDPSVHVYQLADDVTFVPMKRNETNDLVEDTTNPEYHKRWQLKEEFTDFPAAEVYAATL